MKNKTSYLSLIASQTFGKVLAWTAVIFAGQVFLFRSGIHNGGLYYHSLRATPWIFPLFLIGIGGIYMILMLEGSLDGHTRTGYFWMRLSLSMKDQMWISGIYFVGCMLIFLAFESVLMPVSWRFYSAEIPGAVNRSEYYQAIYEYGFFHALCPLADVSVWVRNLFYVGALVVELLVNSWEHRLTGRTRSIHLGLFSMIWFSQVELGESAGDVILSVFLGILIMYDLLQLRLFTMEKEEALAVAEAEKKDEVGA